MRDPVTELSRPIPSRGDLIAAVLAMGPFDAEPEVAVIPDAPAEVRPRQNLRFDLISWLMSAAFHAALFVAVGYFLGVRVGIRLPEHPWTIGWLQAAASPAGASSAEAAAEQANDGLTDSAEPLGAAEGAEPIDLFAVSAPSDPTRSLPRPSGAVGTGSAGGRAIAGLAELTRGASGSRTPMRGQARTSVFGTSGSGYKFVYVFDRSGSMGGSGHTALEAAKAELLKSLNDLSDIHLFEIIFYNDAPAIMQFSGPGRLVFANQTNKTLAREFIAQIQADGATNHEESLVMALRLKPDVIFFLTDADEPTLSRRQLARIKQINGGATAINCIEFGLGPSLGDDNFLVRLARENGGQHAYFDVSQLKRRD